MQKDFQVVQKKLVWMREQAIWPNGLRYLWTDAFGVVLLVSLYYELHQPRYLQEAEWVVAEVERVLGRPRGLRIGEEADRDGQYFHYLAMWAYALGCLGKIKPEYHERAVELVRTVHPQFVVPGQGVYWKMLEDLSGPYPGYGFGALDPFLGYVIYRLLDAQALHKEIADLRELVDHSYATLRITQDLGLGMMLWLTHFFPNEAWAHTQRHYALEGLERLWIDPPGYFCREPHLPDVKYAFTNYGISLGLQAVGLFPDRVAKLHVFFETYRSYDQYDTNAITHVMACTSHFPGVFIQPPEEEKHA